MLSKIILFSSLFAVLLVGAVSVLPNAEAVERYAGIDASQVEYECRTGQVLVFKFNANNQVCTSSSTADLWERLGIAKILKSSTQSVEIEQPTIPKETMAAVPSTATQIFVNGEVYTIDDEQPWAQAFAIKDGKFIGVGSNDEMKRFGGAKTETIDLQGKMVLPGFIDPHQHWELKSNREQSCPMPGPFDGATKENTRAKIKECQSEGNDFNGWFVGVGYSDSIFPDKDYLPFLDELISDKPAFFLDESGHNGIINSKGIEVLGLTKDTPDLPGGAYEKDDNGELTGRLIEDPTINFVQDQIPFPPPGTEFHANGFKIAMDAVNSFGITGFQEGMVMEKDLAAWEVFLAQNEPTVRGALAFQSVGYDGPGEEIYGDKILEITGKYDFKDWPVMVKMFADGTTEGENAAYLEPYSHDPNKEYDKLTLPEDVFRKVIKDIDAHDLQIKIHVNGDKSARVMLDIFEEIVDERGFNENRHHLAHNSVVDPEDIPRYRQIGVAADWIPALGAPSQYYLSQIPIMGEDRWFEKTYPMGSIANQGGVVAVGTDWPLTPTDPFFNIQTAVTRQNVLDPENEMVLNEKHEMTLPQAIQMYTINGAYVMHNEEITGTIEEGKSADFVVISDNIFDVPEKEIHNIKVLETFFKGNQVYKRN